MFGTPYPALMISLQANTPAGPTSIHGPRHQLWLSLGEKTRRHDLPLGRDTHTLSTGSTKRNRDNKQSKQKGHRAQKTKQKQHQHDGCLCWRCSLASRTLLARCGHLLCFVGRSCVYERGMLCAGARKQRRSAPGRRSDGTASRSSKRHDGDRRWGRRRRRRADLVSYRRRPCSDAGMIHVENKFPALQPQRRLLVSPPHSPHATCYVLYVGIAFACCVCVIQHHCKVG